MSLKQSLKPHRFKVILAAGITLVWYIILYVLFSSIKYKCLSVIQECFDYSFLVPIMNIPHCGCYTMMNVLTFWLILLTPGIFVYIVYSVVDYLRLKNEKR
ncbi:MAG: hypothetical protein NDI94_02200 [Candidatus Woesearchaeota archaeon]|nr:hypothetical protein [Candidatus Woesearchaeota archaeon]